MDTEIHPLRLYTLEAARELLGDKPPSMNSMYQMVARKQLQSRRVGPRRGLIRIPGWALLDFIGQRKDGASE